MAFSFLFPTTAVMGILNVTPDSFSDGGRYITVEAAVDRALAIQREGAQIIDIGAQSTRPGATPLSDEEEWTRLAPVLEALRGRLTVPLSVDTFFPSVAERALQRGACILNDVSGSLENGFPSLAARYGAGLVMMARDAAHPAEIRTCFEKALAAAAKAGCVPSQLCLDLGIGFHRTRETDLDAIRHLADIVDDLPQTGIMAGASRKRVVAYAAGDCPVEERLGGTLALHTAAQLRGATVLRAHDVKDAVQAAAVIDTMLYKRSV